MAHVAIAPPPRWRSLPARWSRGLWRRARRGWRWAQGDQAGDAERLADSFAEAACRVADHVDSHTWQRWQAMLHRWGYATTPQATAADVPATIAKATALYERLERLVTRVEDVFERDLQSLPTTIESTDARCLAVLQWAAELRGGSRVADLGCGAGRFLHAIGAQFPALRLHGLDVATSPLRRLAPNTHRVCGGLLSLPFATESFDAALMVESLEHSLRPRRAVEEALRVLRPGGSLLIIDKNRSLQARCDHEPWERWFALEEVSAWMSPLAAIERKELLPDNGHDVPSGLFCLWIATKHEVSRQYA